MRIVHLTSVHPRYDTRIFFKQCRSLAAAGHEVILVVADHYDDEWLDGVRIISVGSCRGRIDRITRSSRLVVRKALELNADLYHCHDPELLLWTNKYMKNNAVIVYDMHENPPLFRDNSE